MNQKFAENQIKSDEYCANLHLGLSCCPDTHRCCDVQSQQLTSSADNVTLVEVTVIEPLPEEDHVVEEVINTSVTVSGMKSIL